MWKLGRLLHLLNIGTCCCVTMSTSTTRTVCWLWWTSTIFRSCGVLLHNWDINDHDVVDQRDWCLQHLWHIDNFVNGLACLCIGTSITLSMNCI